MTRIYVLLDIWCFNYRKGRQEIRRKMKLRSLILKLLASAHKIKKNITLKDFKGSVGMTFKKAIQ